MKTNVLTDSVFKVWLLVAIWCSLGFMYETKEIDFSHEEDICMLSKDVKVDTALIQLITDSIPRIPFEDVEIPPALKGCKKLKDNCEQRNCFEKKIGVSVRKRLNSLINQDINAVVGVVRIKIQFLIDVNGVIKELEVKGGNTKINTEISNVLQKAPIISSGEQNGRKVNVVFKKDYMLKKDEEGRLLDGKIRNYVNFREDIGQGGNGLNPSLITPFQISFCKKYKNNDPGFKKCLKGQMINFVKKNYDRGLIKILGISGETKINCRFTVSKCGNIINLKTKGEHPSLEKEAKRVLKLLFSIIKEPTYYKGQPININSVSYTHLTLPTTSRV